MLDVLGDWLPLMLLGFGVPSKMDVVDGLEPGVVFVDASADVAHVLDEQGESVQ